MVASRQTVTHGAPGQEPAVPAATTADPALAVAPPRAGWERMRPWALALVFAGVYATIPVARFHRLAVRSFDLGIYEQAVRHYASLQAPIIDLEGAGHHFLGDHWNPALAVFRPFYRLFPGPVTLLVGQAVVIALAVVPITRAGMRHLGRWPVIEVGLAFGMSFGRSFGFRLRWTSTSTRCDWPCRCWRSRSRRSWRGRRPVVVAWMAPLVLVKEDLGLTVAALGLVLVLVGARRWGRGLGVFGVASFGLTNKVLIPHFTLDGGESKTFSQASKSAAGESLGRRIYDLPFEVVTSEPWAITVLLLLAVTAFLATRSPLLNLVLPTLGWRFLSTNENFWGSRTTTTWY